MTVPVNIKSGLGQLVDDVEAFFVGAKLGVPVVFGFRERAKQPTQGVNGRIVFAPGDDAGNAGPLERVANPGTWHPVYDSSKPPVQVARIRALAEWQRTIVVSIWARDPSEPSSERKQCEAVEQLLEWLYRATAQSSAGAANAMRKASLKWSVPPIELKDGAELRLTMTLQTPLFDVPTDMTYPTANPGTTNPAKHPQS